MKRWHLVSCVLAAVLLYLMPTQALAYSYGDANTEDVAETYKLIEARLGVAPPDWVAAEEAHKVRRAEIASHFGEDVAVTLDHNFRTQDASMLIANYKAVLAMNLNRRFTYAIEGIGDYAAAKLLLAKAKATFDTLAPFMPSGASDVTRAFEEALAALGNPGLFNVGKKEAQPEVFKEKVKYIYDTVKPMFPYTAYVAPAEPAPKPAETTPAPEETPKPAETTPAPEETTEPAATESPQPSTTSSGGSEPAPAAPAEEPAEATQAAEEEEAAEPEAAEEEPAEPPQTDTASADSPEETPAAEEPAAEPASTTTAESAGEVERTADETAAHAPMERTDRTNPWVSVAVIGGVVAAGAAGFWFARKKKWL